MPPANSQTDEKRKRLAAALHKPEQLDEPLMQAKEKQAYRISTGKASGFSENLKGFRTGLRLKALIRSASREGIVARCPQRGCKFLHRARE